MFAAVPSAFPADLSINFEDAFSSWQFEFCALGFALLGFKLLERRASSKISPWKQTQAISPREAVEACDYSKQIKACGRTHDVQGAWRLWSEMLGDKQVPSSSTLGSMVEALVANGCTLDAWKLANKVWANPDLYLCGDITIYSCLLRGFARADQHAEVVAVYDEMQARSIPMNTVTYNRILNSMTHTKQMHRVPGVLASMKETGARAAPDSATFSTIIKGSCLADGLEAGLQVLHFMRTETTLKPDQFTYNTLLECCAQQARVKEGLQMLDQMRSEGIAPSNYTLSIAVKLLSRVRCLKQAFELVEEVSQTYGVDPNIQTYTCLMRACFYNQRPGKAFDLHNDIVAEGRVALDRKTYTVLARGCLSIGAPVKAAMVARCAYHLPCDLRLRRTAGRPLGLEQSCLEEVLRALAREDPAAAGALKAEIESCSRR